MNIHAENVELSFGGTQILNQIGIDVRSREFVGVIGPNGSGKSTFLKCIYRVLKPDGGDILLDDAPISAFSVRETAKRLAVLSLHNYYNFEFPVRDIVLMGRMRARSACCAWSPAGRAPARAVRARALRWR